MKVIVIIPALNEEKTIAAVINAIPKQLTGITEREVIVIDDGSTDATAERAKASGAHVVQHAYNMGVGAAFQRGVEEALKRRADIIVNVDADGQFDPGNIPQLISPILQGRTQFVSASRFATAEVMPDMPEVKKWGNRWMVRIVNFLTGKNFTDVSCGFRAFTREAALRLTLFGHFTYTQEMFIDLASKDIAMAEVPIRVRGEREHGRSRVADNLWRYGIKSATIIFRAARDYYSFYFFGVPGILIFLVGFCLGLFVTNHYLQTGQTFPYRQLVTASGVLLIFGALLFMLAMIADMMQRNRKLIEQTLYLTKKRLYKTNDHAD